MPKYIRTEKGIYETSKTISVNFKECYIEAYDTQLERWVKKDIIEQADTIEELCDEFVVVNNTCFNMPQLLGTEIDKDYYKHEEVYGAIWTDKGLIYVAKIDNEGKLVLI